MLSDQDRGSEVAQDEKYDVVEIDHDFANTIDRQEKEKQDRMRRRYTRKKTQSVYYDLQKTDSLLIPTSPLVLSPNKKRVTIKSPENIQNLLKRDESKRQFSYPNVGSTSKISDSESSNKIMKYFPVITDGALFDHKVYFSRHKLQPIKQSNNFIPDPERDHSKIENKKKLMLSKSIDSFEQIFRTFDSKRLDVIKKYQNQIKKDIEVNGKKSTFDHSSNFINTKKISNQHVRTKSYIHTSFVRAF